MDIGEEVRDALRPFSSAASDDKLEALARAAIAVILEEKSEESALSPSLGGDIVLIKRSYSALVCIFLEAARTDLSSPHFLAFLTNDCSLPASTAAPLCDLLAQHKPQLRRALLPTANHTYLKRLTGVEWRLDYCVSASQDKGLKELLYFLGLKTLDVHSASPSEGTLEFACTVEQLQDLLAQLKDACKALERGF
ncbi:hypothetical protein SUGI_0622200 [Cryptomeria japonica]|uniref:uncharacterized protein LOC131072212 n=1 Tax=Cryptomeria japonica TaxID=3369 RepID=UPI002414B7EC|nr:uncharacterized protein LOC131072212 [Cryptomeria japonica]GLJ31086.1 hypothetical protein SUGI_0622200 [Cryptomeria japonica]